MKIKNTAHIGIIGGGIAGSTISLRLAELGVKVTIFESGPSLVNGPPFSHLHVGGNMYREISDTHCIELLKQGINTIRLFPNTINYRPTVIAIPKSDVGEPLDLLPRLRKVQKAYKLMTEEDESNAVLGDAEDYYKVYYEEDIIALQELEQISSPVTFDDWMIPVAQYFDMSLLKFPIIIVQEYGWSTIRTSATMQLALSKISNCDVKLNSRVVDVNKTPTGWNVVYDKYDDENSMRRNFLDVDLLVNACGYQTGGIDDAIGLNIDRMIEFKASYLSKWENTDHWPEVVIHGTRGTPRGMVQFSPHADNIVQIHAMTNTVTLFENGLVRSPPNSSQPVLKDHFKSKITTGWSDGEIEKRTNEAIQHVCKFLPIFKTATAGGLPLFGIQQIVSCNPCIRVGGVKFYRNNYVRVEIVKASSALSVSNEILKKCIEDKLLYFDFDLNLNSFCNENFKT